MRIALNFFLHSFLMTTSDTVSIVADRLFS